MTPAPNPPTSTKSPNIVAITFLPPNFFFGSPVPPVVEMSKAGAAEPGGASPGCSIIGGAGGRSDPSTGGNCGASAGGATGSIGGKGAPTLGGAKGLALGSEF